MVNRFLFSVGLAFLIFTIGSLFILIPLLRAPGHTTGKIPLFQPVIGGTGGGNLPIGISASTADPGLVVEYEWPKHVDINSSESISVALTVARTPFSSELPTPTPIGNVSDRGRNTANPTSLEAEEETRCLQVLSVCHISNIFGDGYQLSVASAYMVTTSFDTQLMGLVERSTDQPFIEWDWNIFPKSIGLQVISVGINLQWTPIGKNGGSNIVRQLWESPIAVEVDRPFIDIGQLSLSSTISGIFGVVFTGVSLPWILDQRSQKQEKKKKTRSFCRFCGTKNSGDFEFCYKCGKYWNASTDAINSGSSLQSSSEITGSILSSIRDTKGVQGTPKLDSSQGGKQE